jgi:hypothetical protein
MMIAEQANSSLTYKKYKVIALNRDDATYFVEYVKDAGSQGVEYCWCQANRTLNIRSTVEGYLCPAKHRYELPTLTVVSATP